MTTISDSMQRPINYLRISVTDRCNLRCIYCVPSRDFNFVSHDKILKYEEIITIATVAAELGINKVRLTGGEPLQRLKLESLVSRLSAIKGIDDISMTTNGILLMQQALPLKNAGLKRVNISLDTLDPEKFAKITRFDKFNDVISGIQAAVEAGLHPVKINVVAMKGINDDEIPAFVEKTVKDNWNVRFIELMPFISDNPHEEHCDTIEHNDSQFISVAEIKKRIEQIGKLETVTSMKGNGPAKYYRLPGAKGTIGFISPVSEHFCFQCNRLRLTADGKLRPCLLSDNEIDLKDALRDINSPDKIREAIINAIKAKPKQHNLANGTFPKNRNMSEVGG
jgi:GTP 3',8-cyclase